MKRLICDAFCAAIDIHPVPIGWAIQTPYMDADGDPLLVYLARDTDKGWRIEDDGNQVPLLEACGVDLSGKSRGEAFSYLLREFGAQFDSEERTLHSPSLAEADVGAAVVRFIGLLLRLQDLALLSTPFVRSTFRDDALAAVERAFKGRAIIEDRAHLGSDAIGPAADIVIRAAAQPPIALYIGTSEERALHAIVAKMEAQAYLHLDGKVALMVERAKKNPVKERTLALAYARLDSVLAYRGVERDTIVRLQDLAGLAPATEVIQ